MPIITNIRYWRIPLIITLLTLLIFGGKKGRKAGIFCVILLAFTDPFTAKVIKPYFHRIRPCFDLPNVYEMVGTGNYSFPSSHSVNTFAIAALIFYYYRKIGIGALIAAAVVSFSRIYVGVHYPLDVIGGMLFGTYSAVVLLIIVQLIQNLTFKLKQHKNA